MRNVTGQLKTKLRDIKNTQSTLILIKKMMKTRMMNWIAQQITMIEAILYLVFNSSSLREKSLHEAEFMEPILTIRTLTMIMQQAILEGNREMENKALKMVTHSKSKLLMTQKIKVILWPRKQLISTWSLQEMVSVIRIKAQLWALQV